MTVVSGDDDDENEDDDEADEAGHAIDHRSCRDHRTTSIRRHVDTSVWIAASDE